MFRVNRRATFGAIQLPKLLFTALLTVYKNLGSFRMKSHLIARTRMFKAYQALMLVLAYSTEKQLAAQVQFLKAENEILRARLKRSVIVTSQERQRLVKLGKPLGTAIRDLITIVTPRTFSRWVAGEGQLKRSRHKPIPTPGRPKTPEDVRALVVRLARENDWGYTRILGELRKLNVTKISRQTVKNILVQHGLNPGPHRGEGSWEEFLKIHAQTLWACDFFSKYVWTPKGLVEIFALFFIHVGTRRVHLGGMSPRPNAAWIAEQAESIAPVLASEAGAPPILIHDYDSRFTREFDDTLRAVGVDVKEVGPRKPNQNAYAERWVQSVQKECLNRFIVFGQEHLQHILRQYVEHYNEERPHQARDNLPLSAITSGESSSRSQIGTIECHARIGGLLNHYVRAA